MAKCAEHGAGNGLAVLLFDAAHLHAEVASFDDDADALRRNFFFDGLGDLACHAFLNLQATREHIYKARDFAESENFLAGQVSDVGFAEKRKDVVFAKAEEFDVLDDDHFVVADAEGGAVQNCIEILVVAAGEKLERFFKALRRFAQAFAVRIFADQFDDFAHMAGDSFRVNWLFFFVEQYFFRWLRHFDVPWLFPCVLKAVVGGFLDSDGFKLCMGKRFQALENFNT